MTSTTHAATFEHAAGCTWVRCACGWVSQLQRTLFDAQLEAIMHRFTPNADSETASATPKPARRLASECGGG